MDEPKKDNEQLSDSELFDVTVRHGDEVKASEEPVADEVASFGEGVEKTGAAVEAESQDSGFSEASAPEETIPEPVVEQKVAEPGVAPSTAEPVAAAASEVSPVPTNSGGVLVLQWLSYAFWGWFGTALAVLSGITISFFLSGDSVGESIGAGLAYPLAAVIVMLIISLTTDFFYARHEPAQKTGAANVIMLIHVVLYLLVTVGALITIVFAFISMLLADANVYSEGHNGQKIAMLTAALVAVTFGALSFRALFGGKKGGVRKLFWLLMSILALVAIVSSVAGPAMKVSATKDDRLIETALPALASDINDYARTNDKLPATLSDVKSSGYGAASPEAVQTMISKDLVTYKPNTKAATSLDNTTSSTDSTVGGKATQAQGVSIVPVGPKSYYYQLCVTYKEAAHADYYRANDGMSSDYTSSSISTYAHPKGEVCYDVAATGKYSYDY